MLALSASRCKREMIAPRMEAEASNGCPQRERPERDLSASAESPPGRDALQGRVRPRAYGAARTNVTHSSCRLGLPSVRPCRSPVPAVRTVPTYPAAGTGERRRAVSCASCLPRRDWRYPHSSAPPDCLALLFSVALPHEYLDCFKVTWA